MAASPAVPMLFAAVRGGWHRARRRAGGVIHRRNDLFLHTLVYARDLIGWFPERADGTKIVLDKAAHTHSGEHDLDDRRRIVDLRDPVAVGQRSLRRPAISITSSPGSTPWRKPQA